MSMYRTALCIVLAAVLTADVNAQYGTVYAYNQTADAFDSSAQGVIWQELGLLDGNGRPATVRADGKMVDAANNVVGSVIKSGDKIIGYVNNNGTKAAYNLNGGATANQAWLAVNKNGTFEIYKHGTSYTDDEGVEHKGGGIVLDNGQVYDGFKRTGVANAGTGVGYLKDGTENQGIGAYSLDARAGDDITIKLSNCYSAADPDGAGGQLSVVQSVINNVAGAKAGGVAGNVDVQFAGTSVQITGTQQAYNNAVAKLVAAAKKAGVVVQGTNTGDWAQWINSLPFAVRYSTIEQILQGTGASFKVTYSRDAGKAGIFENPVMVSPLNPGNSTLLDLLNAEDLISAQLQIDSGDLLDYTMLHLEQLGVLPTDAPDDMILASGIFDFRNNGFDVDLADDVTLYLDLIGDPGYENAVPYLFDDASGTWLAMAPDSYVLDTTTYPRLIITTSNLGIITAFVPEPTSMGLLTFGAITLLRRKL